MAIVVNEARCCNSLCSEDRDPDDIEDLENMLEWHAMQVCLSVCVYVYLCIIT